MNIDEIELFVSKLDNSELKILQTALDKELRLSEIAISEGMERRK